MEEGTKEGGMGGWDGWARESRRLVHVKINGCVHGDDTDGVYIIVYGW